MSTCCLSILYSTSVCHQGQPAGKQAAWNRAGCVTPAGWTALRCLRRAPCSSHGSTRDDIHSDPGDMKRRQLFSTNSWVFPPKSFPLLVAGLREGKASPNSYLDETGSLECCKSSLYIMQAECWGLPSAIWLKGPTWGSSELKGHMSLWVMFCLGSLDRSSDPQSPSL